MVEKQIDDCSTFDLVCHGKKIFKSARKNAALALAFNPVTAPAAIALRQRSLAAGDARVMGEKTVTASTQNITSDCGTFDLGCKAKKAIGDATDSGLRSLGKIAFVAIIGFVGFQVAKIVLVSRLG